MTNKEAIEVIKLALSQVEWDYPMDYAVAFDMAIKALEQGPTTKNDLGVDCISRAEAIKCLECDFDITGKENMKTVVNYINSAHDKIVNLPRVKQEPKTGHWIRISPAEIYECSACGQNVMTQDICAYKFCHGCGAKMVEPQESEDKE